jgi:hypothetical protein
MLIKVHGGVVGGDNRGLCPSCENGCVREFANNDVDIWCSAWEITGSKTTRVLKPVTRCSAYAVKGSISQREFEKIAWFINADKKSGKIGFTYGKAKDEDE